MKKLIIPFLCFILLAFVSSTGAWNTAVMVGGQTMGEGGIELVQSTFTDTTGSTSTGTVGGSNWTSNNTTNNLLVVMAVCSIDSTNFTFDAIDSTDDKSGGSHSYTLDVVYDGDQATAHTSVAIWSTIVGSSGQKIATTITTDQACNGMSVFAAEFSGVATSSYIGNNITAMAESTTDSTATINVSTANSVVIGVVGVWQTQDRTFTVGSGYTVIEKDEINTGFESDGATEYQVFNLSGNKTINFTIDSNSNWSLAGVEYLE